jgi:uncharacterized protein (TIGR01777 family)
MPRVLMTGAGGLIGTALLPSLESSGAEVIRLTRRPSTSTAQISWDPRSPLAPQTISGFEAVIHLAGETVVGRWTAEKKCEIRESRVSGTQHLATALAQTKVKPRVFVCASAVGFYGNRGDEVLTEESASGRGFAADLGRDWEAASRMAADAGIRTLNLRIGVVLTAKGGALGKMLTPFKLGLGGRIGSGRQWWSWIHIYDIVGAIHHLLRTESVSGPVNLVAPHPATNLEFTRALARALGRPALFPIPAMMARLVIGEMATELMCSSQRVVPRKLHDSGYKFRFEDLGKAFEDLLG